MCFEKAPGPREMAEGLGEQQAPFSSAKMCLRPSKAHGPAPWETKAPQPTKKEHAGPFLRQAIHSPSVSDTIFFKMAIFVLILVFI